MEFVLQAINHPTYLEDLTGLTELMNAANTFDVDWDDDAEEADFSLFVLQCIFVHISIDNHTAKYDSWGHTFASNLIILYVCY